MRMRTRSQANSQKLVEMRQALEEKLTTALASAQQAAADQQRSAVETAVTNARRVVEAELDAAVAKVCARGLQRDARSAACI